MIDFDNKQIIIIAWSHTIVQLLSKFKTVKMSIMLRVTSVVTLKE